MERVNTLLIQPPKMLFFLIWPLIKRLSVDVQGFQRSLLLINYGLIVEN